MVAVDRWDQKLGKYSLHRRHKFKKHYRDIMLIIIYFAILQDELHFIQENINYDQHANRVTWY